MNTAFRVRTHVRVARMCVRSARRGVALLVVLWTVAVLVTVTAVASTAARSSASIASNRRAQSIARSMAESGIVAATAFIDDSLRMLASDSSGLDRWLSALEPSNTLAVPLVQDTLADGVFAATVVDVSARLDVNNAGVDGLRQLFRNFVSDDDAARAALAIDARVRGVGIVDDSVSFARQQRDSLAATLLGRSNAGNIRRPFESLDELAFVPGVPIALLERVVSLLTVDGDGRINRRAASPLVLGAASGSLVDRPSRLLLVARGWQRGHALTREIQAVYDVSDDGLRLVRWREQDR